MDTLGFNTRFAASFIFLPCSRGTNEPAFANKCPRNKEDGTIGRGNERPVPTPTYASPPIASAIPIKKFNYIYL